ncbi:stress-activated map kinase-interacting protein 1 [Scaptodrosophila lebanonensis]|uniref:Stress-activated map kinase-interacting protein 1 n=1 Tax=Drosophila lebanonensis TaxID=7225 RepID=A0A6J2U8A9_DROLE|nr:stress-activated map kinase-interacting protein 1 [Scaptodrosophila lebanonensis]
MATYSNQHWLLSHIRNSFVSTDDTGMCETVMLSDDMPKHFLRKFQTATTTTDSYRRKALAPQRKSLPNRPTTSKNTDTATPTPLALLQSMGTGHSDPPLQEADFVCYPGLDLSDDEDLDTSTHSFDIQMYSEVGAHRFRSNTAQKLEKLDIAKRKAARIKSVNYNEEVLLPERKDFFKRKTVAPKQYRGEQTASTSTKKKSSDDELSDEGVRSKLSEQLAKSPKQVQNKFIEYARFDGTSQVGMQTKRINVYLNMLPEPDRNYPLKICVLSTAKIIEVIGFVCFKATNQYPEVPLKSVRHYALYMTEDNDDMEDFPPLDNREPCSKFGFSHLTLAERRPLPPVTRVDYHSNLVTKSMTSEEDKVNMAEAAVRALQNIDLNGGVADTGGSGNGNAHDKVREYEERMLSHNEMLEAPIYRTYRLSIIDKRFFKYDVTLGVSGERIEIDQHKNTKFWPQKKSVSTPIESVAHCEIVERRQLKALLRIWLKSSSSSTSSTCTSAPLTAGIPVPHAGSGSGGSGSAGTAHSPNSPGHYPQHASPFGFLSGLHHHHSHIRFKHYDFDTDLHTAEQINNKLNCILKMRSSDIRREFLQQRERKQEKQQAKKQLKL